MAGETELERMVVRLIGDTSDYQKAMVQAEVATRDVAREVERHTNMIEGFGKTIEDFAGRVIQFLTSLGTRRWLEQAFGEFDTMERTAIQLTATLEAQGRAVHELVPEYQAWAAQMQLVTEIGDDSIISLLRQAEAFGQTGDAAKQAVQEAIALAKGNENLANTMLRVTAAMAKGDIKRAMLFSRPIAELRGIRDVTEFQRKYNQLVESGFNATIRLAKTASGQIKQLGNAYGDLMEEFGAVVAQFITPFVGAVKDVVSWFQKLNKEVKEFIVFAAIAVTALLSLGPVLAVLRPIGTAISKPLAGIAGMFASIVGFVLSMLAPVSAIKNILTGIQMILPMIFTGLMLLMNPLKLITTAALVIKGIFQIWYLNPLTNALKWILTIGSVMAVLITKAGGIADAWKEVEAGAIRAWEWLAPIRQKLTDLFTIIVDFATAKFLQLGEAQLDFFRRLIRASGVTWQGIQDMVVAALEGATDFLNNFVCGGR